MEIRWSVNPSKWQWDFFLWCPGNEESIYLHRELVNFSKIGKESVSSRTIMLPSSFFPLLILTKFHSLSDRTERYASQYNPKVPQPQKRLQHFVFLWFLCQVVSTLHHTKCWTRLEYGKCLNFEVEHFRLTNHFPLRFKTRTNKSCINTHVFRVNLSHEIFAGDVEPPLIPYLRLPLPLPSATSTEWAQKVQQFRYGSQVIWCAFAIKTWPQWR